MSNHGGRIEYVCYSVKNKVPVVLHDGIDRRMQRARREVPNAITFRGIDAKVAVGLIRDITSLSATCPGIPERFRRIVGAVVKNEITILLIAKFVIGVVGN